MRHRRAAVPYLRTSLQLLILRQGFQYGTLNCSVCVIPLDGVVKHETDCVPFFTVRYIEQNSDYCTKQHVALAKKASVLVNNLFVLLAVISLTTLYNILNFPAGVVPVSTVTAEDEQELKHYTGLYQDNFDKLFKEVRNIIGHKEQRCTLLLQLLKISSWLLNHHPIIAL